MLNAFDIIIQRDSICMTDDVEALYEYWIKLSSIISLSTFLQAYNI